MLNFLDQMEWIMKINNIVIKLSSIITLTYQYIICYIYVWYFNKNNLTKLGYFYNCI